MTDAGGRAHLARAWSVVTGWRDRDGPPPDPPAPDPFIAVPQTALVARLRDTILEPVPAGERAWTDHTFSEVCRLLGLLFRIEGRECLRCLRDDYHAFNPDLPAGAAGWREDRGAAYDRLKARLSGLLIQANFAPVDPDRLAEAERRAAEVDAEVRVPTHHYADVAFFARGRRQAVARSRRLFGLAERIRPAVRLRHVVVLIRFHESIASRRRRLPVGLAVTPGGRPPDRVFEGKVVIKLFTDVAEGDLNMLYPGARAVMRLRDKLLLGVPAVAGGVPVLMNILPALSVLFVVAAAWLGLTAQGSVAQADLAKALAAMSALAGLGGFLMRQWIKFERQVLKYQMILTDNLYYRNVCNNAAVFDYLLGTAEDQEFKEAVIAYTLLRGATEPMDAAALAAAAEAWLDRTLAARVRFDIDDALGKLDRLGLLTRAADGTLSVPPLAEALARLRAIWHHEAGDGPSGEGPLEARGSTESAGMDAADGR
ncbi:TMEM143 family protein [Roseospira navarrensis]|uniref:DUF3754 domain-containing protein n=1 Tax=Roseospira navarrensis TaxID=140058 RepID=A0A7X1ZCI5_9PROT|nr:TMEM143 family protein [Roseospira navarrensis]MQX36041.1 DUF3754 domain-containing protein [Roseospira navarrensis]